MVRRIISFQISVPTDNGFIGRSCGNPECGKYFRIQLDSIRDTMCCPYCGSWFSKEDMMTLEQETHFRRAAMEQAKELVYGEMDKMLGDLARRFQGDKHITFRHSPAHYRAKSILPGYRERPVDSELRCSHCHFLFQVYGIFGYCPGCGSGNLRIYDANLEIIKQEVNTSKNKYRALRHAYADFVSTFEMVAASRAEAITSEKTNFQDLYGVRRFFKKRTLADIFDGIDRAEIRQLQRVFQKRHIYEHNNGIISDRYVRKMPEDAHLHGQKAQLSIEELETAAALLRQVLDKLVDVTT